MYHIITNLELMFDSLREALEYVEKCPEFVPKVPYSTMPFEDRTTKRICAARTIQDCVSALKPLGIFRRCLDANEDTKSYENGNEAYPVILVEFDDSLPWITPTKSQVPDVDDTHELWLLEPARPKSMRLRWLNAYSIGIRENEDTGGTVCADVTFVEDIDGFDHPWLNGKGHYLDTGDMGREDYKDLSKTFGLIYFDSHFGGQYGYAIPTQPFDGRFRFFPLDASVQPYKTYPNSIHKALEYRDENGNVLLEHDSVRYHGQTGTLFCDLDKGWYILSIPSKFEDGKFRPDPSRKQELHIRYDDILPGDRIKSIILLNDDGYKLPENY